MNSTEVAPAVRAAVAARFLIGASFPGAGRGVVLDRIRAGSGGHPLDADHYRPDERAGRARGAILLVHGLSLRAERDPRLVTVARALAGCGFHVFAPSFPAMREARIALGTIDDLGEAVRALACAPEVGAPGRVAVFAVSFSAGSSLLAAARPEVGERISALCAIGTYADGPRCVRWAVESPDADPYGRLVTYRNFLPPDLLTPGVGAALDAAIADQGLQDDPRLPRVIAALAPADRALYRALTEDPETRRTAAERMLAARPPELSLSPLQVAGRIKVPVTLVHGRRDKVIPARHSVLLAQRLAAAGADVHLRITPLLGHGDTAWGPRSALGAAALWRAFAHFFHHARP